MSNPIIRIIYLYLFALVGLIMVTFGGVRLVDVALRTWVFTEVDKQYVYDMPRPVEGDKATTTPALIEVDYAKQQRQRDIVNGLSLIVVGLPLWMYHWRIIKQDNKKG